MQLIDILLGIACTAVAIEGFVLIFMYRTTKEQEQNTQERLIEALSDSQGKVDYQQLSQMVTDLHRELKVLEAGQESLSLRVTDQGDKLDARFNRLRMRQRRADAEEESEAAGPEEHVDPQLLLDSLNGQPEVIEQSPRRARLVPKSGRGRRRWRG